MHFIIQLPKTIECTGFCGGSDGKVSAWNAGDLGSIPGSGRSPEEGNGNHLRHSCLENSMDRFLTIQATREDQYDAEKVRQRVHHDLFLIL